MKSTTILYAVLGTAAVLLGLVVPYLVHSAGGAAVPGWRGLVSPGPLSKAHSFIGEQCETCHTPHVGVEAKTCIACHATTSFADKQSTRFHTVAKECTSCHVEHDGGSSLARMDHNALTALRFWKSAGPGEQPEVVPARATGPMTALPVHPSITGDLARLDCASCHSNRDPHRGFFGQQCSSCHTVTSWSIAEFRHPSTRSTECAQCHQPPPSHYMMHFEMVSQRVAGRRARVEQCFACHATDDWNNIKGAGWYDHH